jgi:hypothetical protein
MENEKLNRLHTEWCAAGQLLENGCIDYMKSVLKNVDDNRIDFSNDYSELAYIVDAFGYYKGLYVCLINGELYTNDREDNNISIKKLYDVNGIFMLTMAVEHHMKKC